MGIYTVKFSITAAPAITNYFIAVLYKTSALGSEVQRIEMGLDHSAPQNVEFSNLDPANYYVKIHESVDNITLGNLRHDFWVNAVTGKILFERLFYMVDGPGPYDPVAGSDNITDPYFDGKLIAGIFQEGFRYLVPGAEWQQNAGGVLQYLLDTVTSAPIENHANQIWSVEMNYTVLDSGGGTDTPFTEVLNLVADYSLTGADANKIVSVIGGSSTQTTALPLIGSFVGGKGYLIQHDGGSAINVMVRARAGEVIKFRGVDTNSILLAKGEYIKLIKNGATWLVIDWQGQWPRLGEAVDGDIQIDNSLIMDGTDYDGTVHMRAYDFIANKIPAAQKVDYATWAGDVTKQGFFAIDTIGIRFRVPNRLSWSKRYLKNIGGADALRTDNVPGGFQNEMLMPHTHPFGMGTGTGPLVLPDQNPVDGNILRATGNTSVNVGVENIVKNIGVLPLMLI